MMINIRNPNNDETPTLRNMWKQVFGGEGEEAFFNTLYAAGHTIVVECDGELAAMGYIVPCGELTTGAAQQSQKCAMLYSIATLPKYRGRGLGAAVTNKLIDAAYELGYKACVLCPSEDSLFNFYSTHTAMREWFYADISTICADELPQTSPNSTRALPVEEITPSDYSKHREAILKDTIHLIYTAQLLSYQKKICEEAGGGLYKIGNSCAAIEKQKDGNVCVKELLLVEGDDTINIIRAISNTFSAKSYTYRTPAKRGQGTRFGMIVTKDGKLASIKAEKAKFSPWYGLAFD